ncbi:unnamed protein product [Choristocarpus tenellus]
MFGEECEALKKGLVATVQAVGGTGGLRLAFELLQRCCRIPYQLESGLVVYVPSPSWPNHVNIALESGVAPECLHRYRYYDEGEKEFNFKGMLEDLRAAPPGAVVLLHVCAHNPTGMDPTPSQWESIAEVVRKGALIPLFDNAYQGFATGKLEEDAYPVCLFERRGLQFLVVCSFSKSMGLYSTRTGALHAVCSSRREAEIVLGNLKSLARPMYSNPPAMGARAAAVVMSDKALKQQWKGELSFMAGRISRMRQLLVDNLKAVGAPGCWDHLVTQRGMFGYTGLTTVQVKRLREDHHVYMSSSGRISMAGVNKANVKVVASLPYYSASGWIVLFSLGCVLLPLLKLNLCVRKSYMRYYLKLNTVCMVVI